MGLKELLEGLFFKPYSSPPIQQTRGNPKKEENLGLTKIKEFCNMEI